MSRLFLALVFFSTSVPAQDFDHTHKAWDALVKKHVLLVSGNNASQVRYAEFARDRAALKAYLGALSGVAEAEFKAWSKPQQMAFLINAYNAYTVEKILTRFPDIKSIWDFGKVFGNPFKDEFFMLLGRKFTLDGIEHETLRKKGVYDEPRVHFAVNCASVGCPMLREEAYVSERLEAQLAEQARRFLADRSRNRLAGGKLEVSKIFDWFKEDFGVRERFFASYAAQLADGLPEQKLIADGKAPLAFLDYDWALNDARK